MRLFNAHRPSGLGHAMEPVLKKGLRVSPIGRADVAYNAMSHRARSIFKNPGVSSQCAGRAEHQVLAFLNFSTTPLFASLATVRDLAPAVSARTAATHETNSEALLKRHRDY